MALFRQVVHGRGLVTLTATAIVVIGVLASAFLVAEGEPQHRSGHIKVAVALLPGIPRGSVDGELGKAWDLYDAGEREKVTAICRRIMDDPQAPPRTRVLAALLHGWSVFPKDPAVTTHLESAEFARRTLDEVKPEDRPPLVACTALLLGMCHDLRGECREALDAFWWGVQESPEEAATEFSLGMAAGVIYEGEMTDTLPTLFEPELARQPDGALRAGLLYRLGEYYQHTGAPVAAHEALTAMLATGDSRLTTQQWDVVKGAVAAIEKAADAAGPRDTVEACLRCWKRGNLWATRRLCVPEARDRLAAVTQGEIALANGALRDRLAGSRVVGFAADDPQPDGDVRATVSAMLALEPSSDGAAAEPQDRASMVVVFGLQRDNDIWRISTIEVGKEAASAAL